LNDISNFTAQDFLDGQLLLIDKPLNWTSFDAVKKLRYLIRKKFNLKKLKVGHAGTLDPLATGLLIICTGKFTKRISDLTVQNKVYEGTVTIGATTPSFDLETAIENETSFAHITPSDIEAAVHKLTGELDQVPPAFSAKWVDGKRAYIAAREGREIELKSNKVEVEKFDYHVESLPEIHFNITCSKGTYIRSIARDLGAELGTGAYLTALRRTAIGDYCVKNALTVAEFERQILPE